MLKEPAETVKEICLNNGNLDPKEAIVDIVLMSAPKVSVTKVLFKPT